MRAAPLSLMLLVTFAAGIQPVNAQSQTPVNAPSQTTPTSPIGGTAGSSSPGSSLSPYLRGVATGTATTEPLSLTVLDAIDRALKQNLGTLLADQRVTEAGGTVKRALSALLPNASGRLTAARQKVNLEAFGFPLPAGIPPVVGPFNVFDARVAGSTRRLRAPRHAPRR